MRSQAVPALEFLVIVYEASDGLGASPGAPGRRRFWCWRSRTFSGTVRAVSPTASDAAAQPQYTMDIACEALEVSKFAVDNAVGRTKDELLCGDEIAFCAMCALIFAKKSGPAIARGPRARLGELPPRT